MRQTYTALIAEDEPLLAAGLQADLAQVWPQLQVLATVGDGKAAVQQALALQPDVLFFDIRMPGQSGLEAAAELGDLWPVTGPGAKAFPALVFVTAFDQYAIDAFEAQAMDYLLKPVLLPRLEKTVKKVQETLAGRLPAAVGVDASMALLGKLLQSATAELTPAAALLKTIPVSVGNNVRMVAIAEVDYFEAADKYIRVLTTDREYLIRTPLKELLAQLDPEMFCQIHRGTVVRRDAIDMVSRDEAGKTSLKLRGHAQSLPVSRLYTHLFKPM